MRAKEFITEQATLKIDNPGGTWLQDKIEDIEAAGVNQYGAPKRFGSATAWFTEPVMIPVEVAAKVRGERGEQDNVRKDSLTWLINFMKTNNHLPKNDRGEEYAPFIVVDHSGTPWVNEGNHRIMAAKALGWKYIPVELKYFTGGENQDGLLSPTKVKNWNEQGKK